jgi:integrase
MNEVNTTYPLTLKSRFGKVKIYRTSNGGYSNFVVSWNSGRKRLRKSFNDPDLARTHAEKVLQGIEMGEASAMTTDLRDLAYYKECERLLGGIPLRHAIEFFIACNGAPGFEGEKSLQEIVVAFLKDQAAKGNSQRDTETLTHHLDNLCKVHGNRPIIGIKPSDFDSYLQSNDWSNRTKNNHRVSFIRCWKWARSKGFLPKGIDVAPSLSTKYKSEVADAPGVFSPEEVVAILEHVDDDWLPCVAIRAFAGLRSAESLRLDWSQINTVEKTISLGRSQTKTKKRRIAHMPDNLVQWLKPFVKTSGPVCPAKTSQRATLSAANKAGVKWVHNGLRHSYISYQMALLRNAPAVAEQCGNSEAEVQQSYKALVSESEARKYFSIFPTNPIDNPGVSVEHNSQHTNTWQTNQQPLAGE